MMRHRTITVSLPDGTLLELERVLEDRNLSLDVLVAELLQDWLDNALPSWQPAADLSDQRGVDDLEPIEVRVTATRPVVASPPGKTETVSLAAVVDALDTASDEVDLYVQRATGEVLTIFDPMIVGEDVLEDQPDPDDLDSDEYIALPTRFDIDEWGIMRSFCEGVDDEVLRQRLLRAIHGRGAFRRFKDEVYDAHIQENWFEYRYANLTRIARDFLLNEQIPFTDDVDPGS